MATLYIYGRAIELTNLSRVMYPGEDVMTGDVLHYYYRIADTIMPHIRGRMLSVRRFPDGVRRPERCETGVPERVPEWVRTCEVDGRALEETSQVIVDEPATLVYMAQQACITPYIWLSRAREPSKPDQIVFDLDPAGPEMHELDDACRAARLLRSVLEAAGLTAFVMTTGSRGLHVRAPIAAPAGGFEETAAFAAEVAELVAGMEPDRITTSSLQHEREGKVLIGHRRNAYGHTVVAPYALRALPGAPVATPLRWNELGAPGRGPRDHTITSVFTRLAREGDPWERMASARAPLPPVGDDRAPEAASVRR